MFSYQTYTRGFYNLFPTNDRDGFYETKIKRRAAYGCTADARAYLGTGRSISKRDNYTRAYRRHHSFDAGDVTIYHPGTQTFLRTPTTTRYVRTCPVIFSGTDDKTKLYYLEIVCVECLDANFQRAKHFFRPLPALADDEWIQAPHFFLFLTNPATYN